MPTSSQIIATRAKENPMENELKDKEKPEEILKLSVFRLLSRDEMKIAVASLDSNQARMLIEMYYDWQKQRIQTNNRVKIMLKEGKPCDALKWLLENQEAVEVQVRTILHKYAKSSDIGRWCMSNMGVGGVLAAAMLAYLDPLKAPTAGHFFSYAGYTPEKMKPRAKGVKLTHNPSLKRVCFLLGESFVKVSNKEDSVYGKAYRDYVERVTRENDEGKLKDMALELSKTRNYAETTEAMKTLKSGKLPKLIIHQRAKHSAVLLFLSHLHQVWRKHLGLSCPEPWIIQFGGHGHKVEPINTEGLY